MNADLTLAFADFAAAFAEDAERALCELQALFLDEASCRARIEYLVALAEAAGPAAPRFDRDWSEAAFARELLLLRSPGLFPAFRDGRLHAGRLVALASDPNALCLVHEALLKPDAPAEKAVPAAKSQASTVRISPAAAWPARSSSLSQIESSWTLVAQAHADPTSVSHTAAQAALMHCRDAIYRYLLTLVRDADTADELCSEFALRFLSGRYHNIHPEKGRFRDMLRTALNHLLLDYQKTRASPRLASADALDSSAPTDAQFLEVWRTSLLNKAWEALADEEQTSGRPVYTVLHLRAENPDLRSAQMAELLSARLGRPVTADWVRRWLNTARQSFADLLLKEVVGSLRDPSPDALEEELVELGLIDYCKAALEAWRRQAGG